MPDQPANAAPGSEPEPGTIQVNLNVSVVSGPDNRLWLNISITSPWYCAALMFPPEAAGQLPQLLSQELPKMIGPPPSRLIVPKVDASDIVRQMNGRGKN